MFTIYMSLKFINLTQIVVSNAFLIIFLHILLGHEELITGLYSE